MEKWKKRMGYGVGDLGCNLVFGTMASYLMFFYKLSMHLRIPEWD